jgi:two-component system sensor histidine kinase/response regulator
MITPISILIVDDEPDNFDTIETLLSDPSYDLHYASSGPEAIALMDTFNPDLILLDVMMPEMDGMEVCRRLKAVPQWQPIPIIMVTALSGKTDLANCLAAGADDFISKPVNSIELRARVQSMIRIKHQYDSLQRLLTLREDMVKMIIHDLRNPLSNVILGVDVLKSIDFSREKQQRQLNDVYASALSLQMLIDDLLQISLLESGVVRLNCESVNVGELVASVVKGFQAIAAQRRITLATQLPPVDVSAWLDFSMMHRTLDNLVSNAIKFSPMGSTVVLAVEVLGSGDCQIQVMDEGPGVDADLKNQIFQKYAVGTLMDDVTQIGLGLAFCKLMVEAHQGTISVAAREARGSIFELRIPAEAPVLSRV